MKFSIINKEQESAILGSEPMRMEWGYFFPANAVCAVGARLLYQHGLLAVVGNRVSHHDYIEEDLPRAGKEAVKRGVIKKLENYLNDSGVSPAGTEVVYGEADKWRLLATPNGSHGYIYFSFWEEL